MKKKFLLFLMILTTLLAVCFGVVACSDEPPISYEEVYTVRFYDNYSSDVTKVEVEVNKTVENVPTPTREGYVFKGWYLSSENDATEQFDATKAITADVTVYAKWEKDTTKNLVTLKYLNYSTADTIKAVATGSTYAEPETPKYDENETYSFVAWYTDEACTNEYDFSAAVNEDITLYAGWAKAKAVVKFDANFPTAPAVSSVYVKLGEAVEQPADPARNMYEFNGWYTERIGGIKYDFANTVNEDMILYGHWARSEYNVNFKLNGATVEQGTETSFVIKRGQSAEAEATALLEKATYVGRDFAGWYNVQIGDEEEIPANATLVDITKVDDDMTIYAKWTLQEYEVSFNYNYDGAPEAPEAQTVKYGKLATEPEVAERDGYMFVGWFKEETLVTQFTFDMPVEGEMTLYAKWIEDTVEREDVTVTYYYNINGTNEVYATKVIAFNGNAASDLPADPSANNFYFGGWYVDETYTTKFNTSMSLLEDISVYAKMLKKYTFEAEATDFTGKTGQGTSTNSFEEQMIMDYTFIKDGSTQTVSNGYFVRELYSNGSFLAFQITAKEACDDAVIYLRVSSESYEFLTTKEKDGNVYNYLSDEEFVIMVNGTKLNYDGLYMPMANQMEREDLAQNKTPFEDCFIALNIKLNKGVNNILLLVANNNNHGGTFHAEAPIIDCMYIYSGVELTMPDYKFYERENVQRG